jgi:hypothetical protein
MRTKTKVLKAKATPKEKEFAAIVLQMVQKTETEFIIDAFEAKSKAVECWLKNEKHWAIWDMMTSILVAVKIDYSLYSSIEGMRPIKKIYNRIGDKLDEWDQVKKDWKL